jgi:hypothetical protein
MLNFCPYPAPRARGHPDRRLRWLRSRARRRHLTDVTAPLDRLGSAFAGPSRPREQTENCYEVRSVEWMGRATGRCRRSLDLADGIIPEQGGIFTELYIFLQWIAGIRRWKAAMNSW